MGWYVLSAPGTEHGPCLEACDHIDCAKTRVMAGTICEHCGKPIGYDTQFYFVGKAGEPPKLEHFVCAQD